MVPIGEAKSRGRRIDWLRERLAEGNYDWRSPLQVNLGPTKRMWTRAEDAIVTAAWRQRTALPKVAEALGESEAAVAKRLMRLRLADGVVAVTDRLPYDPDGLIATQRAIALNAAATGVHVLVIKCEGVIQHVSVHHSREDAEAASVVALAEAESEDLISVVIVSRQVGGGKSGKTSYERTHRLRTGTTRISSARRPS